MTSDGGKMVTLPGTYDTLGLSDQVGLPRTIASTPFGSK